MNIGEPIPGMAPQEVVKPEAKPTAEIEQIKKELIDPRAISKKIDPGERSETAQSISEARTSTRTTRDNIAEHEQKVQEIAELTSASYEQERQRIGQLTQRLETIVMKLKNTVGIEDRQAASLQEEIDAIKSERDALYDQSFAIGDELKALKEKQAEIPKPKELLEAYYEKMSTQPLSNEQKRELLKPEVLSSLSEEEYIALWRRLNPYFLSHVTRQGFRDHTGGDVMVSHSSGYREFINGFVDVMKNGRKIFPPLARVGIVDRNEETIESFLSNFLKDASNADEAKNMFVSFLNDHLATAPKYPDTTATHLAAQMVSDRYYGGERGNEVFFIYPSDVLASQYAFAFNGWEKDFTEPQSEIKWNDVFIWTDLNNPGVPVDSGIVFLPESTPVDPETGSKYESEVKEVDGKKERVMVKDDALVASFVEWGEKIDNQSVIRKTFNVFREERHGFQQQQKKETCLKALFRELQSLGFKDDASAILASELISEMYRWDSFDNERLREIAEGVGADLKRAETTVPAKEYWEAFFAKNPQLRPKHVHYYDGSPTTSVFEFQQQNGIGKADTSKTDGQLLGFDDHHVLDMKKDPRANVGYDELVATADKIIKEKYNQK